MARHIPGARYDESMRGISLRFAKYAKNGETVGEEFSLVPSLSQDICVSRIVIRVAVEWRPLRAAKTRVFN